MRESEETYYGEKSPEDVKLNMTVERKSYKGVEEA